MSHLPPFRLEDRAVESSSPARRGLGHVPAFDEAARIRPPSRRSRRRRCDRSWSVSSTTGAATERRTSSAPGPGARSVARCRTRRPPGPRAGEGHGRRRRHRDASRDRGRRPVLLRTDADSLPRPEWAARMVHRLASDADLVAGRMVEREDEALGLGVRLLLTVVMTASQPCPCRRTAVAAIGRDSGCWSARTSGSARTRTCAPAGSRAAGSTRSTTTGR